MRQVERWRHEEQRKAGAHEQLMKQLLADFQCKTTQAAEKLLAELAEQEAKLTKELDKALADFEENWGDKL